MLGIFLVISTASTTALISLFFTIIMFEINNFKISRFIAISSMIIIIILIHPSVDYILIRIAENFANPEYMSVFFDYKFMYEMKTYFYFIFGSWIWEGSAVSSHLDILLLLYSMGLIGFYIMYKIFLRGFFVYRKNNNIFTIYSYILLSTFVNLYHHAMTLTVNVIILVIFISNRVNNTIKPKFKFDVLYLFNQFNQYVASKVNKIKIRDS